MKEDDEEGVREPGLAAACMGVGIAHEEALAMGMEEKIPGICHGFRGSMCSYNFKILS